MRQKRRSGILRYMGWALGLIVGCGLVFTGLWRLGIIEIAQPAAFPAWMSKETASPKPTDAANASIQPSPAPTKDAKSQPAAPSAAPDTGKSAAGDQLLVQSTNTATVSDGAKAWLDELAKVTLKPNELFSLDAWVKNTVVSAKLELKQDEISQIAGLLYETALRAGLTIGERHIHQELPAYATAGYDVAYQDGKDLTLFNPNKFTMQVGVALSGSYPIVYLKGSPDAKWTPVSLEVVQEPFQAEKVELVDFNLGAGKGETTQQEGKPGLLVQVKAKEGDIVHVVAKDYYAPLPKVVARGPTAEEMKTH